MIEKEFEFAKEIAIEMSKATNLQITPEDYLEWMEPVGRENGSFDKFDDAVLILLGERSYSLLNSAARLPQGVYFKLFGNPKVAGGINVERMVKGEEK